MNDNHRHARISELRKKLLTAMILVPAVPFFLVLALGYYQFTRTVEDTTFARISRIANDHRRVVQMFLDDRRSDLAFAASAFTYEELVQPGALGKLFLELQAESPAFVDLGVFNGQGIHVAYQGPWELQGKSYADAPWFRRVLEQGYYVSDVFLGYRKVPHFVVAVRAARNGESWVLRATIDTQFFTGLVEGVRIGQTGEAYIVNSEGVLQTERRSGGEIMSQDMESIAGLTPRVQVKAFVRETAGGHEYVYATAWLNDHKWILVVRQEVADAFSSLRETTYLVVIIVLLGGAGIVAIAFLLTGSLVQRIEQADREKKELDQQLIMASRLAELGEMSAGFAHEINNPLQVIRAEQALIEAILGDMTAKGQLPQGEDTDEMMDSIAQIRQQVDRCGTITQAILKFARQKEAQAQEMDPGEFVLQVADMVRKKAEVNGIALHLEAAPGLPRVEADPGHLQQVLLNLLNNAFDAVGEQHGASGGEVRVRVTAEDGQVLVSVSDNGSGISPDNLERIFQPFFTTKPVGKGTGLGLSVCYGIMEKMGGSLEVQSSLGKGTTFLARLPAQAAAAPATAA